jgi:integrase
MLRHAKGRDRPRLVLALFTGLRASEMRAVRWTDTDLSGNSLTVRQRADWWGNMGNLESKRGQRTVPLIPLVVNAPKKWRPAVPPDSDLVFPGRDGGPISHSAVMVALDRLHRAAGIVGANGEPKYTPHILHLMDD